MEHCPKAKEGRNLEVPCGTVERALANQNIKLLSNFSVARVQAPDKVALVRLSRV